MFRSIFLLLTIFCIYGFAKAKEIDNLGIHENDIFVHFKAGSSKGIARFFDDTVLLNINGENGDYSKNQAEYILKDFFIKNPPLDFTLLHRVGATGSHVFYVGSYDTIYDQFRILIKGNPNSGEIKIVSIDIIKIEI